MRLAPGSRLGPYEVVAQIGAGGMGEVYRARDGRLNRDVALKVLPDLFASDPDRLARFQREAQVLATLKHPNIGIIYGLEESEHTHALVLELIEGETLADAIARGPVPVSEALAIAMQVAHALEAAHEQGVIHRDLKPANIKVTSDGEVKVLDFGLARLAQTGETSGSGALAAQSMSPTITTPAATGIGVMLGTAAYMAPEQAKGKTADKRSDVWAFGCVLFEMLTGKRPFEGEDVSDTLANVLKMDPDWNALPKDVPPAVRTLLTRCLEKDRRKRISDIAAALFALDDAARIPSFGAAGSAEPAPVVPSSRWRLALVGVLALLGGGAIAGSATWLATRVEPPRVVRTTIMTAGETQLTIDGSTRDLAITADGSRVVYVASNSLVVRPLDSLDAVSILSTGRLPTRIHNPFVSPDGEWVGYEVASTSLRKVSIGGGPPITISMTGGQLRGAAWLVDDTIVFATNDQATGLRRVSAGGGAVTELTKPDRERGEGDHVWPEALPGGRAVLFTVTALSGGLDAAQIEVLDLVSGQRKILVRGGSDGRYVPSGHIVFAAGATLRAVAFDEDTLETRGTPVPVLPRLVTKATGAGDFAVASDGTLVYADGPVGGTVGAQRTLVWVDRAGREEPVSAPPRAYVYPRISPEGGRVVLDVRDQERDIWLWDLARNALTRVTLDPGVDQTAVWAPDGRRLFFASGREGITNLFSQPADGSGMAERLAKAPYTQNPTSVSPDGRFVVFYEIRPAGRDIMMLTLDGGTVQPLFQTRFDELNGDISPDGRWLAYESNSSGRVEVYVSPFPNVKDGQKQVSTGGGMQPGWARSGQEMFYFDLDGSLMSVRVTPRPGVWNAASPTKLFDSGYFTGDQTFLVRNFDVSPDGQRFLMIKPGAGGQEATSPHIVVVQNWLEELRRLVPTN